MVVVFGAAVSTEVKIRDSCTAVVLDPFVESITNKGPLLGKRELLVIHFLRSRLEV